jgi:formylglycine-generating enzyme
MNLNRMKLGITLAGVLGIIVHPARATVVFPFVTVGDVGNPNDTNPGDGLGGHYGSVGYTYQISATAVTNAQYTEFLNAVDAGGGNGLGLYDANMSINTSNGGILFSAGASNGSKYSVKAGFTNKPVVFVSFLDSMRFVNWLGNGQGTGDTETGAYTLSLGGLAPRNAGAAFFIPTRDEWYKTAYYDPTKGTPNNYYLYGTHSDTLPAKGGPTSVPNVSNYDYGFGAVTDVGAYTNSASYYGAFDMAGNVWNWTEAVSGSFRELRGESWGDAGGVPSSNRSALVDPAASDNPDLGFRVAVVPEPSAALLACFGLGLLASRRNRKTL